MTQRPPHPDEDDDTLDLDPYTKDHPVTKDEVVRDGDFHIGMDGVRRAVRNERGHFVKGTPRPGGGRRAGVKFREFRDSLIVAFHENGGTAWLAEWGRENPTAFFKLMGKMVPTQFQAEVTTRNIQISLKPNALDLEGDGEGPLLIDEEGNVVTLPAPPARVPRGDA